MPHVLLIDDDQDLVAGNKVALEKRGFKVSAAYTGNEGWQVLEKARPDLVVLDCMMEEFTSGFELAQDIAAKYPKLPVLMLTGVHDQMSSDWSFSQADAKWLPIHKWLEKPVPPGRLIEEIEALLKTATTT